MKRIISMLVFICIAVFAPVASASPLFQLILHSEPGDWLGQGLDYSFTNADGTLFTPTLSDFTGDGIPDYVHFFFLGTTPGIFWGLDIGTNQLGVDLAPGFYDNAERAAFATLGHPGLDFFLNGRGCNTVSGNFTISGVTFSGLSLDSFHASFEDHCEGGSPALFGSIDFDASPVPEPSTWLLLGSGLAGLAAWRRKKAGMIKT